MPLCTCCFLKALLCQLYSRRVAVSQAALALFRAMIVEITTCCDLAFEVFFSRSFIKFQGVGCPVAVDSFSLLGHARAKSLKVNREGRSFSMSPPERDDTVFASLEPEDDCPPHSQQSGRFCPEYKAKVESVSPSEFDSCGVEVKTMTECVLSSRTDSWFEPFGFECCQQECEQSLVALRYPLEGQKTLPSAESLEGGHPGIRRILSWPSLSCRVQQQPGFHREVLQPFYSLQPVSNVVMGLVYGSSSYAQQCVSAGLATIIHTSSGCFLIMPNPKYHSSVVDRECFLSRSKNNGNGKFRFVAWWLHPKFVPDLQMWFDRARDSHQRRTMKEDDAERIEGVGSPGDFQFSDVAKPSRYLNTYRDLHSQEHLCMLRLLKDGTERFLKQLFGHTFFVQSQLSMGFHYPVRTQYATLHMQVRINSNSVCSDDGRGVDMHTLVESLQRDLGAYERDEETLQYEVTENIRVSLLAAASQYQEVHRCEHVYREMAPLHYELGSSTLRSRVDGAAPDAKVRTVPPNPETTPSGAHSV